MTEIDDRRITRMIRQARKLQVLAVRLPCRLTLWLLKRQVDRIIAAQGPPPSHLAETFGRLHAMPEHPAARAHQSRVRMQEREAAARKGLAELQEIFASVRSWPNDRKGSGSRPSSGLQRQRRASRRNRGGR